MTIKYIIYARKSSESEDRQMASIDDQISEMKRIAKELNLRVVDTISESKSAKAPGKRVGFNQLITRIEKGEADGILCWKLNRLARNPMDGGKISWLLQNRVIKKIKCYSSEYKPEDNVLMMTVELGMANQYVKDLSTDVKRGMRKKAERGWYPGCRLPLGYKHNPGDSQNEIIIDHNRIGLVKRLWRLVLDEKASITDVKRFARDQGLRNKQGKCYSYNTFMHLLRNEFYAGWFCWKNESGDPERIKGKHESIISESEFREVQSILNDQTNRSRIQTYNYPFKEVVVCGECGNNVTCQRKVQTICTKCKTKFSSISSKNCSKCGLKITRMKNPSIIDRTYYHCTGKTGCRKLSTTLTQIEDHILAALCKLQIPSRLTRVIVLELERLESLDEAKRSDEVTRLRSQIQILENRIDKLILLRLEDEISDDELQKIKRLIEDEKTSLVHLLERKTSSNQRIPRDIKEWLTFLESAYVRFQKGSLSEKSRIALKLRSNLVLKDKKLYFSGSKLLILLQDVVEEWNKNSDVFEPEIPYETKGSKASLYTPFSIMLAKIRELRTCLIPIILEDKEKMRLKKE